MRTQTFQQTWGGFLQHLSWINSFVFGGRRLRDMKFNALKCSTNAQMKQLFPRFDRKMKQFLVPKRIRPHVFQFDKTIFNSSAGKQQNCYMMKYELVFPPSSHRISIAEPPRTTFLLSIGVRV